MYCSVDSPIRVGRRILAWLMMPVRTAGRPGGTWTTYDKLIERLVASVWRLGFDCRMVDRRLQSDGTLPIESLRRNIEITIDVSIDIRAGLAVQPPEQGAPSGHIEGGVALIRFQRLVKTLHQCLSIAENFGRLSRCEPSLRLASSLVTVFSHYPTLQCSRQKLRTTGKGNSSWTQHNWN